MLTSARFATGDTAGFNGYVFIGDFEFTDAAGFAGNQLYVWFTDGSVQNILMTGFGVIPSDGMIPNSVPFGLDSSNAASLTYLAGYYDPNGINLAGSGGNVVAPFPEPSTAVLGLMSALVLFRRHRG